MGNISIYFYFYSFVQILSQFFIHFAQFHSATLLLRILNFDDVTSKK